MRDDLGDASKRAIRHDRAHRRRSRRQQDRDRRAHRIADQAELRVGDTFERVADRRLGVAQLVVGQ